MKTTNLLTTILLITLAALLCGCGDDDDSNKSALTDDTVGDDDDDAIDDTSDDDDDTTPGVWIDQHTDLEWQDPPNSSGVNWYEATAYCDQLDLDGHDDWRLPTISELRTLITGCHATETGGECPVTDECTDFEECWYDTDGACNGGQCKAEDGPTLGCYQRFGLEGECGLYWSGTESEDYGGGVTAAYGVPFQLAMIVPYNMNLRQPTPDYLFFNARCVR